MKTIISLLISILVLGNSISAQSRYKTKDQKKHYFLSISKKYCSDAYSILKSDKKAKYTKYSGGNKKEDLIQSFNTVIHETLHGYNFDIGGFEGAGYYLGKDIELIVPKTEVVN